MWIGVLWAGLRAAMRIAHVGGKFRHGLLQPPKREAKNRKCLFSCFVQPKVLVRPPPLCCAKANALLRSEEPHSVKVAYQRSPQAITAMR